MFLLLAFPASQRPMTLALAVVFSFFIMFTLRSQIAGKKFGINLTSYTEERLRESIHLTIKIYTHNTLLKVTVPSLFFHLLCLNTPHKNGISWQDKPFFLYVRVTVKFTFVFASSVSNFPLQFYPPQQEENHGICILCLWSRLAVSDRSTEGLEIMNIHTRCHRILFQHICPLRLYISLLSIKTPY